MQRAASTTTQLRATAKGRVIGPEDADYDKARTVFIGGIEAMMAYAGDRREGEQAMAPFRALATPLADMVKVMPYPEIYPPDSDEYHPISASRTMFIDSIDRNTAAMLLERLASSTASMAVAQLRVLGGAMARVPADATAFAHRSRGMMVALATLCERTEDIPVHDVWAEDFRQAMRQGDDAAYVNFIGTEDPWRIAEAYPPRTWERLAALKRRYDPTNLFRLNQNIPPAGG